MNKANPRSRLRSATKWVLLVAWILLLPLNRDAVWALEPVTLALPASSFQMAVFPLAKNKGYMKEEGIDLKTIVMRGGLSVKGMLAGDVDFTMAGTASLIAAMRGVPVKCIYATNDQVLQWILAKKEIKTALQLKGKRLGVGGLATGATLLSKQALAKQGLNPDKDLILLNVGSSRTRLAGLLAGSVDATMLGVDQRYMGLEKGMTEILFVGDYVKNAWGTLGTTTKLIKEKPEVVSAFIRATTKGLLRFQQDRDAAVEAMVKFSKVDKALATRTWNDLSKTFTKNGVVNEETQNADLAIIQQVTGVTKRGPNSQYYDFSFALNAEKQLKSSGWQP